ncbi:MAG TPA: hypothetical protein VFV38_04765 [Ktedonobacteraceae bacterium]|nr:hypothetical protein [Ktedonobacteraceae bacterium]
MVKRCEFIAGMNISYDDGQRLVVINGHILHFGYNQYTILSLLLVKQEVEDSAFAQALYGQEADTGNRRLVARDISRLRGRLRAYDLDIKRVYDQGYRLVSASRDGGVDSPMEASSAPPFDKLPIQPAGLA